MTPNPPASGVPQPPWDPQRPEPKSSSGKDWGTVIVVVLGLLMAFGVLLVLPIGFFGPVIILCGIVFGGLVLFHYLVWGRWLTRIIEQEKAAEKEGK